ncbi:hypothetical protein [Acinetobacter calcoaceticus]|uniref:hypothetical protein n=1 Tax=Acinetobacter calcoaceticus TaxID=471 RepID=UPI0019013E21|nr:hypothetical protein [Acinetobacter calcoaceticus]MBJ9703907.1 hypothetical protein [Acinetobacter calcoaceticus]
MSHTNFGLLSEFCSATNTTVGSFVLRLHITFKISFPEVGLIATVVSPLDEDVWILVDEEHAGIQKMQTDASKLL